MEHKKLFKCQYMYQVAILCLNFVAMETSSKTAPLGLRQVLVVRTCISQISDR